MRSRSASAPHPAQRRGRWDCRGPRSRGPPTASTARRLRAIRRARSGRLEPFAAHTTPAAEDAAAGVPGAAAISALAVLEVDARRGCGVDHCGHRLRPGDGRGDRVGHTVAIALVTAARARRFIEVLVLAAGGEDSESAAAIEPTPEAGSGVEAQRWSGGTSAQNAAETVSARSMTPFSIRRLWICARTRK